MYQMTRLTAERGALSNDDRLDSLAMAVQYWVDAMAQDAEQRIGARREEVLRNEVDKVLQSASMGLAVITGHIGDGDTGMKW
jgi:inactivated superfamily I helicase